MRFFAIIIFLLIIICFVGLLTSVFYIVFPIKIQDRKKALKWATYSIIGILIGFGACLTNLSLGGRH